MKFKEQVPIPAKKIKKIFKALLNELYQQILVYLKAAEVPLFKDRSYKVSASVGIHSQCISFIAWILDNGNSSKRIRVDVLVFS